MNNKNYLLSIIMIIFLISACTKSVKNESISIIKENIKSTEEKDNSSATEEKETILPGNNVNESGINDMEHHVGNFDLSMSGFKGELFIGITDGKFYGTIKFFNWGNGTPQPLVNLKVTDEKIYFKRIIKTKEDLVKYGGTAYFEQDFYGIFTSDKKTIKGYYRYTGTQDNWQALKKTD